MRCNFSLKAYDTLVRVMPGGQHNDCPIQYNSNSVRVYTSTRIKYVVGGTRTSGRRKFCNIFGYLVISFNALLFVLVNVVAVVTVCT